MLPIDSIEVEATLQAITPKMPLVEAVSYSGGLDVPDKKRTFARVGRWRGEDDGPVKELIFIGYLKREEADGAT